MKHGVLTGCLPRHEARFKYTYYSVRFFSGKIKIIVKSEGYEDRKKGRKLYGRCRARIIVNKKDYSPHRRGLNFVVINQFTGEMRTLLAEWKRKCED